MPEPLVEVSTVWTGHQGFPPHMLGPMHTKAACRGPSRTHACRTRGRATQTPCCGCPRCTCMGRAANPTSSWRRSGCARPGKGVACDLIWACGKHGVGPRRAALAFPSGSHSRAEHGTGRHHQLRGQTHACMHSSPHHSGQAQSIPTRMLRTAQVPRHRSYTGRALGGGP